MLFLTVTSRFIHLYRANGKTSRLEMKSFSTVRDNQRASQSHMKKRRGRREIEVTRRRRGGNKRGESKLASNHFPMCSPQSGPLRGVHGVTEKKRGRKETEVARGRNGGIKRRETDAASNQFPKYSSQPRTHKEIHRVG